MAKKENRPSWFKMFRNQKALIDSVPDAEVGQALKAVFQYFETGEVVEMSPLVFAVFSSVRPYIDESFEDYKANSQKNRANVQKRWEKNREMPSDTTGTTRTTCIKSLQRVPTDTGYTEAEAETEAETEANAEAEQGIRANEEREKGRTLTSSPQCPHSDSPDSDFEELRRQKIEALNAAFDRR